jgi:cellulose synthase/poly-beta-1,6-N-acetylglucosamine synthase-like glycosyltransferase
MIESKMLVQLIFWGVWLVIPLMWEIIGAAGAAIILLGKFIRGRRASYRGAKRQGDRQQTDFYPSVSIIVPVFNSEGTLKTCLQSIVEQEYPMGKLEVLLVDNGSSDGSRAVFERFQSEHAKLRLWWRTSKQGKSQALNMGVFSGTGRYVVNIDSDGRLDRFAIANIVRRFEDNAGIVAMSHNVVVIADENVSRFKVHEKVSIIEVLVVVSATVKGGKTLDNIQCGIDQCLDALEIRSGEQILGKVAVFTRA